MTSRYDNREINTNSTEMYKNVLKDRGARQVQQYATPNFMNLKKEQISSLTIIDHIWKRGDHFYKLAAQYYDNPTHWWVIAQFNNLPTEANIQFGDVVLIPNPLEEILSIYTSIESNSPPPAGGY